MSRWTERRERLRAVLSTEKCVHPGSVFDPDLRAHRRGFRFRSRHVRRIHRRAYRARCAGHHRADADRVRRSGAPHLPRRRSPAVCDADHGYGNALNVMRTVEELETAGVAALSIEDTALPQPFGSKGKAQLSSRRRDRQDAGGDRSAARP